MKHVEELREVRGLSPDKISAKIQEYRKAIVKLNQDKVLGHLKKTSDVRVIKKAIARAKTVLDEKIRATISQNG